MCVIIHLKCDRIIARAPRGDQGDRRRVHFQTRSSLSDYIISAAQPALNCGTASFNLPSRSCILRTAQQDERTSPGAGTILCVTVRWDTGVGHNCLFCYAADPRHIAARCECFHILHKADVGLLTGIYICSWQLRGGNKD
jgi:hypothetical protein